MTSRPEQNGDKGQRYEIRYAEDGFSQMKTLGWSDTREGADRLSSAWAKRLTTRACIVVDRQELLGDEEIQSLMDRDRE